MHMTIGGMKGFKNPRFNKVSYNEMFDFVHCNCTDM